MVSMEFFTGMVKDFIFFSGDVKTTALAIAISSSLCCSVVWLVINILSHVYHVDKTQQTMAHHVAKSEVKTRNHLDGRRNSVPLSRSSRNCNQAMLLGRQHSFSSVLPVQPQWISEEITCTLPCTKCSIGNADKTCPRMSCKVCCQGNVKVVCDFHKGTPKASYRNFSDGSSVKPKQVDLSHLKLLQCPDRVGFMGSQLASLDLSNNCLHSLPVEIGCLMGLQLLYLQHNELNQLPVIIRNLVQLQELYLDHNRLQDVPSSVGELKQLRLLSVSHNKLCRLPPDLGYLKRLQHLRLSKNKIEKIPDDMCSLPELKCVQLKHNCLTSLPERIFEMIRLSELDVSNNCLGVLPNNLTKCAFMTRLHCANNRLKHLPSHIHRLQHLKYLNVCSNQLCYFPSSIHGLDLHALSADNNPLWKEDGSSSKHRLCGGKQEQVFPQLTELCALYIASSRVEWRKQNLPQVLEESWIK